MGQLAELVPGLEPPTPAPPQTLRPKGTRGLPDYATPATFERIQSRQPFESRRARIDDSIGPVQTSRPRARRTLEPQNPAPFERVQITRRSSTHDPRGSPLPSAIERVQIPPAHRPTTSIHAQPGAAGRSDQSMIFCDPQKRRTPDR